MAGFDSFGGSKSGGFGGGFSGFGGKSDDGINYEALAAALGKQKQPKKPNAFHQILDLLSRGTYTSANVADSFVGSHKYNPLQAAWRGLTGQDKTTYSTVLKNAGMGEGPKVGNVSARDALGFVGDIALDPTTYISFGTGAGAKIATQGGKAVLNRGGTKALQSFLAKETPRLVEEGVAKGLSHPEALKVAEQTARQAFAKGLPTKFLDKGGIKLFGQSVVEGKNIAATADALKAKKLIGAPLRAAEAAGAEFADAFKVGFKAKKAGGEDAVNAIGRLKAAERFGFDQADAMTADFLKEAKKVKPAGMKDDDFLHLIRSAVESPEKLSQLDAGGRGLVKRFSGIMEQLAKNEEQLFKDKKGAALLENYFPHLFKNKPEEVAPILEAFKKSRNLSDDAFFLKNRSTDKTIDELVGFAKEQGVDLKPLNAAEAIQARVGVSNRALARHDAIKEFTGMGLDKRPRPGEAAAVASGLKGKEGQIAQFYRTKQADAQDLRSLVEQVQATKDPQLIEELRHVTQTHFGDASLSPQQMANRWGRVLDDAQGVTRPFSTEETLKQAGLAANEAPQLPKMGSLVDPAKGTTGWIETGVPQLKGISFEPEVAKYINEAMKISEQKTPALEWLDKAMGLYKGSITSIFPSFHARNKVGNLFNGAYLGGVGLHELPRYMGDQAAIMKALKAKSGTFKVGTHTFSLDDLKKLGLIEGQASLENGFKQANPLSIGRKVGNWVEAPDRAALFFQRVRKGDSISDAVAHVNKYMFDYGNQTGTVKNIGRISPFFTWTANNLPLQLEQLAKHPGKYANIGKAFADFGNMNDETAQDLPGYATEGLYAKIGEKMDKNGNLMAKALTSFGLPMEDLGALNRGGVARTLEREGLGRLAPFLKLPAEIATKRDFYRGEEFDNLHNLYGNKAKNLPGFLQDLMGYREDSYRDKDGSIKDIPSVDPQAFRTWETLPLNRLADTLSAWGIGGKDKDGNPSKLDLEGGAMKSFFPAKYGEYDVAATRKQNDKKAQEELIKFLIDQGILREYKNTYQPKNKVEHQKG